MYISQFITQVFPNYRQSLGGDGRTKVFCGFVFVENIAASGSSHLRIADTVNPIPLKNQEGK